MLHSLVPNHNAVEGLVVSDVSSGGVALVIASKPRLQPDVMFEFYQAFQSIEGLGTRLTAAGLANQVCSLYKYTNSVMLSLNASCVLPDHTKANTHMSTSASMQAGKPPWPLDSPSVHPHTVLGTIHMYMARWSYTLGM